MKQNAPATYARWVMADERPCLSLGHSIYTLEAKKAGFVVLCGKLAAYTARRGD